LLFIVDSIVPTVFYCIVLIQLFNLTTFYFIYFTQLLVVVRYIVVYYADIFNILHVLWIYGAYIKKKKEGKRKVERKIKGQTIDMIAF
jgi:hypothetical protein